MKPFTDGDFVKDCLMAVVEVIYPEKKNYSTTLAFLQELSPYESKNCLRMQKLANKIV